MNRKVTGDGAGRRLQWGATIVAAARGLDLRPIKDRFLAFEEVHNAYAGAQQKLDEAERKLEAAQEHVGQLDAAQEEQVRTLLGCLIADRQPYKKPLSRFSDHSISELFNLPPDEEAREVHRIVTAIRRDPTLAQSQKAAAAAEEAALAVEAATAPLSALQQAALDARRERDSLAPRWEKARAGMAIAARSADHDGNTQYYKTLFGNLSAAPKKRHRKTTGEAKDAAAAPQPAA